VLHFAYLTLRMTNGSSYLTTLDVLGLLVASLCHDIDHPGNNNLFEINSDSQLAHLHNDISVLENHHAYTTFAILRNPTTNIFSHIRRDNYMYLRKTMVSAILATDMSVHFDALKALDLREPDQSFNSKVETDRQAVVKVLIHSADLSGQVFPNTIARVWEERISKEFDEQAKKESSKGLPVLSHMQNLHDPIVRNQNQVSFIDFVLLPWWRSMCRLFPGLTPCYDNLLANRKFYDRMAKSLLRGGTGTTSTSSDTAPTDSKAPAPAPTPAAPSAAAAKPATAAAALTPAPAAAAKSVSPVAPAAAVAPAAQSAAPKTPSK